MSEVTENESGRAALDYMRDLGTRARAASKPMAAARRAPKDKALAVLSRLLLERSEEIQAVNREDLEAAKLKGYPDAFIDRLTVTEDTVKKMAEGCAQVAKLPDPIGAIQSLEPQPSGILVGRMRVPLGVIAIIYESRPNVTVDAAALTLKSGNAAILRGGSEAIRTNRILAKIVSEALEEAGLPADAVQFVATPDRDMVDQLVTHPEWVDIVIPRGGKGLVSRLMEKSRIPMIKHLNGICHTYIDSYADIDMAVEVTDNAKTQRFSPCNTTETLLVHERADDPSLDIIQNSGFAAISASPEDWDTEYNGPVISIKVMESLDEAIDFINEHGSHHTDAIVTDSYTRGERFLREVDSASVLINASTRFADGFEYGLGAEIGISTDKLHARGPVGLEGLTSQKFVVLGHGEGRR